ncbi:hypothetical protein OROMI_021541 [Orobanche minor]
MEVDTILDKKVLNKISIHVLRRRISECRDCSSSCCRYPCPARRNDRQFMPILH